jgi:hypothetical protein
MKRTALRAALGAAALISKAAPFVVYRPLCNSNGWWVRPHATVFEDVVDGTLRPKLAKIVDR